MNFSNGHVTGISTANYNNQTSELRNEQSELFEVSCNNSYFDHVACFAEALYLATGLILINIVGDIRPERQDPFGLRPVDQIPA